MSDSPDAQLLEQFARNQSESAFAELVERYIGLVYSTAFRKTGNPQHAEDITQAVFIILARKAGSLGPKTVLPGWLHHTARLTAANFQRTEWRRVHREQEAFMQSTINESAPEAIWHELSPLLDDAVAGLGAGDRDAIVLRFFQGRSMAEVGAALGASEDAARMRVNRALERLRKFFNKRGVVSTTAVIAGVISNNSVQAAPLGLAQTISNVALVKGTAASTSSLTLVKGGLKLMALSKAKTVTITAAALVFAAGGAGYIGLKITHVIRFALYPNLTGTWEGIMPLGGKGIKKGESNSTPVVLRLSKEWDGYAASLDAVDIGETNVPVSIAYQFPGIQVSFYPKRNLAYQGNVNPSATRINLRGLNFRKVRAMATYTPLEEKDFAPRGAGSDLQGYWKGEIVMAKTNYPTGLGDLQLGNNWNGDPMDESNTLPVNLKIAGQPDGTYRAELDSPMQGADGQVVSVKDDGGTISLALKDNAGMFNGVLDGSGQEMSGSWIQGGESSPAIFKRADYQAELAQQADEDFSPASPSDLQGHWKGSWGFTIQNRTITIPMELDIAKLPDGTYSAAIANLEQFGNEAPIPASSFEYSPTNLYAEWKWEGGAYSGRLYNGQIVGTWLQNGGEFHMVFDRQKN